MLRPVILAALAFAAGYVLHASLMARWLRRLGFDSITQLEEDLEDITSVCASLLKDEELVRHSYRFRPRDLN